MLTKLLFQIACTSLRSVHEHSWKGEFANLDQSEIPVYGLNIRACLDTKAVSSSWRWTFRSLSLSFQGTWKFRIRPSTVWRLALSFQRRGESLTLSAGRGWRFTEETFHASPGWKVFCMGWTFKRVKVQAEDSPCHFCSRWTFNFGVAKRPLAQLLRIKLNNRIDAPKVFAPNEVPSSSCLPNYASR